MDLLKIPTDKDSSITNSSERNSGQRKPFKEQIAVLVLFLVRIGLLVYMIFQFSARQMCSDLLDSWELLTILVILTIVGVIYQSCYILIPNMDEMVVYCFVLVGMSLEELLSEILGRYGCKMPAFSAYSAVTWLSVAMSLIAELQRIVSSHEAPML